MFDSRRYAGSLFRRGTGRERLPKIPEKIPKSASFRLNPLRLRNSFQILLPMVVCVFHLKFTFLSRPGTRAGSLTRDIRRRCASRALTPRVSRTC